MKKLVYALLPLYALSAQAVELTYHNKPVHPDCFAKLLNADDKADSIKSISLAACSATHANIALVDDYIRTKHSKENEFTQYSIIGQSGNKYLIAAGMSTSAADLLPRFCGLKNLAMNFIF